MIVRILKWWPAFVVSLIGYVAAIIASGFGWNPFGQPWNFQNPGAFGDSFGPLNTLVATIAAIGAVAAYRAQKDELDRVKKAAPRERAEALKRDFETTFFNLIQLFRETVKEVDVADQYNGDPVRGRDALKRILEDRIGGTRGNDEDDAAVFLSIYGQFRDDLAYYFRLFYQILKFVDGTAVKNKMLYVRLLRATLSNAEIVLIALNCLHGGGKQKLKPLVEKYSVLHNISAGDARSWRFVSGFRARAFGDRDLLRPTENDAD